MSDHNRHALDSNQDPLIHLFYEPAYPACAGDSVYANSTIAAGQFDYTTYRLVLSPYEKIIVESFLGHEIKDGDIVLGAKIMLKPAEEEGDNANANAEGE